MSISSTDVIAKDLQEGVMKEIGIIKADIIETFSGSKLESTECQHPFREIGYDFNVKVLEADFVNTEQGSGIVHVAPGHGSDDYNLGIKNNIEVENSNILVLGITFKENCSDL